MPHRLRPHVGKSDIGLEELSQASKLLTLLISSSSNINVMNQSGRTALMLSAQSGNLLGLNLLIEAGVDPNVARDGLGSALLCAIAFKFQRQEARCALAGQTLDTSIHALLLAGADVNAPDKKGTTVLMHAAIHGDEALARKFIDFGSNVNAQNCYGQTALIFACREGKLPIVELLVDVGADVNDAITACAQYEFKLDDAHLGSTALLHAGEKGHADIIKVLIRAGAPVNQSNDQGNTALILASKNGNTDSVKELLAAGADISAQDLDGNTALQWAQKHEHQSICSVLTQHMETIQEDDD